MAVPVHIERKLIIMAEEKKTAGRKKTVKPVEVNNEDLEIAKLTAERDEMAKMLKEMQEQMAKLQNQMQNPQVVIQQNMDNNLTRTVKVTSMINNLYCLSTEPFGNGANYLFEKYGESKNIKFTDVQSIMQVYLKQFESGMAILSNKKDYEDLGYGYIYDMVLSKEKMDKVISLTDNDDVEVILGLEEDMMEKVLYLIADRIVSGNANYDYNKIKELEKHTDLKEIIEKLEEDNTEEAE